MAIPHFSASSASGPSYDAWLFDRLKHPPSLAEYLRAHAEADKDELDAPTELALCRHALAIAAERVEAGLVLK
jgi:hypothetical protein